VILFFAGFSLTCQACHVFEKTKEDAVEDALLSMSPTDHIGSVHSIDFGITLDDKLILLFVCY
jgi:hypothetical protein